MVTRIFFLQFTHLRVPRFILFQANTVKNILQLDLKPTKSALRKEVRVKHKPSRMAVIVQPILLQLGQSRTQYQSTHIAIIPLNNPPASDFRSWDVLGGGVFALVTHCEYRLWEFMQLLSETMQSFTTATVPFLWVSNSTPCGATMWFVLFALNLPLVNTNCVGKDSERLAPWLYSPAITSSSLFPSLQLSLLQAEGS